ncbi:MAG: TonB-dependent receptor [Deltaproteobacteria bacterium]|nr:TonB-dependent receptor [Deltaproteobacteria bacterium]
MSRKKLDFKIYGIYSRETYSFHPDWITEEADGYQHQASNRFEIETSVGLPLWKDSTILLGYNFQAITDAQNDIKFNVPDFVSNTESTPVWRNDLFTVLRQNFFNNFTLSGGARVSMISPYHITESYKEFATPNDVIAEQTNFAEKTDIYLVPRASAVWEINNHNSLKVIYETAIENNRDKTITETEHIRSGELVYWLSTKYFRGQLSGYVQQTDNVARRVQTLNSETGAYEKILDNSGENITKGTELEIEFMPAKDFTIGGHVSFQHTKDNKNPDIPVADSPSWIAGFKTVYTIRPWPKNIITLMARGQFVDTMSPDWYWTDQKDVWQRIGDDVPAWFTFGANIRYKNEKSGIILNLHGTNLLNADIRYPASELVNFAGGAFGPGRSIILTAGVDW